MKNELYPIFVKVAELNVLIVGGGNVGLEKSFFMLKSSPNARIEIVSLDFHEDLIALAKKHEKNVTLTQRAYGTDLLEKRHLVIACTDNIEVNKQVYYECKERFTLVNIADTPQYCDYYLGGIVTKGNVKVAISTNGKSPTMAKRLRQLFEEVLPEDMDEVVQNLNEYRKTLKGDFEYKVDQMNEITKTFIEKK
ncbi:precorrin-2 dehydrogenase/sirohydrochlorin ferrochelatase family protein [Urechidicola croceus]|uniref:precorrin-2 dehydrogenase n=1 Tax=Urechidicola croceus TaxID=1850246 RepID=A0A1D8P7P9_9FLAO|nr:bifunctional precorrin-2 dehydrogenase/sirohydrochlorin ferrochelatase [Urechidicola croceus]AOW20606.1 siroheme synthase [Urechidicola croceus]